MAISLSIDSRTVNLSNSRLERIMTQEKEQATVLGVWDKIKDYFRSEKKQDVINKIYDLTHQDTDSTLDSVLEKNISIFCKIRGMSDPACKDLFKLECDSSQDNIQFLAGEIVLYKQTRTSLLAEKDYNIFNDILAADPELINNFLNKNTDFISEFNLHKMNADKNLKNKISSNINKILPKWDLLEETCDQLSNKETRELLQSALPKKSLDIFNKNIQLFKDINRGTFDIDGVQMFLGDGSKKEEREANLNNFLHKLTPIQRDVLDVIGSQTAPIEIINVLCENNSSLNFLGDSNKKYKYHLDKETGLLNVKVLIQQDCTREQFKNSQDQFKNHPDQDKRDIQNHVFWCEGLCLETMFSIAPMGDVICTDFHFSSKETPLSSIIDKQDHEKFFGWLNEFIVSKQTGLTLDAEGVRRLNRAALNDELLAYSAEEKQQMQAILTDTFGQRLRDIMDFAAAQVGHNDHAEKAYIAMRCIGVIEDLITVLGAKSTGRPLTADETNELTKYKRTINSVVDMTQQEIKALKKIDIEYDMLKELKD